ncbi:hypothetical protein BH09CHL1_BH09CHL1_16570 [soil metagenome]
MIPVLKGVCPAILVTNAEAWKNELLNAIASGVKSRIRLARGRYGHSQIKLAVVRETYGKCVYCESKVRHVAPGDIEHIIPKSLFPEMTFEWSNLTFSCTECNRRKLNNFDVNLQILNPYEDQPGDFLFASDAKIYPRPGSLRGALSWAILELNRPELYEMRCDTIEHVRALAETWGLLPDGILKDLALTSLRDQVIESQEHSMVVEAFLRASGVPL